MRTLYALGACLVGWAIMIAFAVALTVAVFVLGRDALP